MSLFLCDKCGVIENTALSSYWHRTNWNTEPALCSECDGGKWHGRFPRETMTDERIAAITDWAGWVMCSRIKVALEEWDKQQKALYEDRVAVTSIIPDIEPLTRIQRMPCSTRSQRRAKKAAKTRLANLNQNTAYK